MKWNFLYQITAASRTPDLGATAHRSQFSLSSTEFVEPLSKKIPGYATVANYCTTKQRRSTKASCRIMFYTDESNPHSHTQLH